ncbi:hypothetical protein [Maribacter sp. 2210JD10-5]|uniref:hypothetical protein n=1 Tax=Maribacter sp. 2210JD10-5 TaxID=3386272 RepID=UPI0039BCFB6C
MKHHGLTDIELWGHISKGADIKTKSRLEAWLKSSAKNKRIYDRLCIIYRVTGTVHVDYDFEAAQKRLIKTINLMNSA